MQQWLNRLEMRLSGFAIPGLLRYIAALNGLVFVLALVNPAFISLIDLRPERILQGQIWRLVSFAFIPTTFSFIWAAFAIYLLVFFGDAIEHAWGSLRLNLFYFTGMLGTVIGAFLFDGPGSATYLNLTLLLAFGTLFPDTPMTFMFVIPMKAKWLAIFSLALVFIIPAPPGSSAYVAMAVALINYLIFFAPAFIRNFRAGTQAAQRRHAFKAKSMPVDESLHRCRVCGKTENSDPDLEFRVAGDGEEYCTEHLPTRTR